MHPVRSHHARSYRAPLGIPSLNSKGLQDAYAHEMINTIRSRRPHQPRSKGGGIEDFEPRTLTMSFSQLHIYILIMKSENMWKPQSPEVMTCLYKKPTLLLQEEASRLEFGLVFQMPVLDTCRVPMQNQR